jgi:hypothetical protein
MTISSDEISAVRSLGTLHAVTHCILLCIRKGVSTDAAYNEMTISTDDVHNSKLATAHFMP